MRRFLSRRPCFITVVSVDRVRRGCVPLAEAYTVDTGSAFAHISHFGTLQRDSWLLARKPITTRPNQYLLFFTLNVCHILHCATLE